MIPRSLVPSDARPPAQDPAVPARRLTTLLDERTVLAANLPPVELQTHSSIPSHMPLDVLAERQVVPRDTPNTPFEFAMLHPTYAPVTVMDERVTVPMALPVVQLPAKQRVAVQDLPDVLDSDVMTTGEVNLMVEPVEQPKRDWNWYARTGSIVVHVLLIAFILLQSRLFPYHPPTQAQMDIARQLLTFIPPEPSGPVRPPGQPSPRIKIDPRILKPMSAPVLPQPPAGQKAPEVAKRDVPVEPPPELPEAPKPQAPTQDRPDFLRGGTEVPKPTPQPQAQPGKLILPPMSSPGRTLEQSAQQSGQGNGPAMQQFGGRIPGSSGGGYGGGGGGIGEGAVQMLTPTEGVDFTSYLARVVASVKNNWYAVMPESARLGDQGRVILQFRIMKNGVVPDAEPQLMSTSSKEPLDRAAMSSIRASTPFEPLPPAFNGPFIELRFIFLYNLPLNAQ